jgi:hypothetical protein
MGPSGTFSAHLAVRSERREACPVIRHAATEMICGFQADNKSL